MTWVREIYNDYTSSYSGSIICMIVMSFVVIIPSSSPLSSLLSLSLLRYAFFSPLHYNWAFCGPLKCKWKDTSQIFLGHTMRHEVILIQRPGVVIKSSLFLLFNMTEVSSKCILNGFGWLNYWLICWIHFQILYDLMGVQLLGLLVIYHRLLVALTFMYVVRHLFFLHILKY